MITDVEDRLHTELAIDAANAQLVCAGMEWIPRVGITATGGPRWPRAVSIAAGIVLVAAGAGAVMSRAVEPRATGYTPLGEEFPLTDEFPRAEPTPASFAPPSGQPSLGPARRSSPLRLVLMDGWSHSRRWTTTTRRACWLSGSAWRCPSQKQRSA